MARGLFQYYSLSGIRVWIWLAAIESVGCMRYQAILIYYLKQLASYIIIGIFFRWFGSEHCATCKNQDLDNQ